jgi:hypothetical protein
MIVATQGFQWWAGWDGQNLDILCEDGLILNGVMAFGQSR